MSKTRSAPLPPVFATRSQLVWTDEKLAGLDTVQLGNLLDNLNTQVQSGRVSEETAADLARRIESRLPARELALRKKRNAAAQDR
jgi:hypothetical protein